MIRHAIPRPGSCALLLAALLAGCDDPPTAPRLEASPDFAILDGARGGTAHFFFLPPMVPTPSYSGTFDGTQSAVVRICELAGAACGATVTSFSGSQVKLDLAEEAYKASWKTKGAGLDPSRLYRIEVLVGGQVLGYADVVVLANGSQIRTVDRDQYVATINGGTLPIRFRIETAPPPPPPPPPAGGWEDGDLVTYSQDSWGDEIGPHAAAILLLNQFDLVYIGGVEVGLIGDGGFSMFFTSAAAIHAYQPAAGAPGPLNNDLLDPTSSASGAFGGYVLALQLDVDFSDAGHLNGRSGLRFGDLRICGLSNPTWNNLTVREFLATANATLGNEFALVDEVSALTEQLTTSFENGSVSLFAQDHLVNGPCPGAPPPPPPGAWENGDLVTYSQDSWGGDPATTAAAVLLVINYGVVYPDGEVEVGISGAADFSMLFTSAAAIASYLPAGGVNFRLTNDVIDPTTTASGEFGGHVLALTLNVDFADAGKISGTTGLLFGNLRLCGLATAPEYSGMTVRELLDGMNTALGFGLPDPQDWDALSALTNDVNAAFESGTPSLFAQDHLVNGPCP